MCFWSNRPRLAEESVSLETQTPGCIAIWANHSHIGENVRATALQAEILLTPHQTGGCNSPDPCTMGLIDRTLWENRQGDPQAICQFSPGMGPLGFGHMGPLAEMTIGGFQASNRLTIDVRQEAVVLGSTSFSG